VCSPVCSPVRVGATLAVSSGHPGFRQLGESEIQHLREAVLRNHDVVRLEVAVDDSRRVRPSIRSIAMKWIESLDSPSRSMAPWPI